MKFVNFRACGSIERHDMREYNASAVQVLENAEQTATGGVWFRPSDFPGCVDKVPTERPEGQGEIFRIAGRRKRPKSGAFS